MSEQSNTERRLAAMEAELIALRQGGGERIVRSPAGGGGVRNIITAATKAALASANEPRFAEVTGATGNGYYGRKGDSATGTWEGPFGPMIKQTTKALLGSPKAGFALGLVTTDGNNNGVWYWDGSAWTVLVAFGPAAV